jgi:signal transduction histidine kinase/ActR/RegA family two-component response regulator
MTGSSANSPLQQSLILPGFLLALALLIGVSWLEWDNAKKVEETSAWVARTHAVQAGLNQVAYLANDIESDERGFIITGDPRLVASIEGDMQEVTTRIHDLARLISDAEQRENLVKFETVISERLELARRKIDLRRQAGFSAVQKIVVSGEGESAMQRIEDQYKKMTARQAFLLDERSSASRKNNARVARLELIGASFSVLLFVGVFLLGLRENRLRQRAIENLQEHEVRLLIAKQDAEHADAAKSTFLATVSHEIRTPLNGLLGMLELLSLTELDKQQQETLEIARDSGRGMGRIINDILDQAKIAAGRLEIVPEPISIAQFLPRLINIYSAVASAKSLLLRQMADPRISPLVMADSLRLLQVLGNFVSNSLKFTNEGYVEVRAELVDRKNDMETIRFSVKDTGIGMSEETLQKLFEPFSQAGSDTSRLYGGTGLGMSISRRLVDLMGGEIVVESAVNAGTTVTVTLTLPVIKGAPAELATRHAPDVSTPPHRKTQYSAPIGKLVVRDNGPRVLAVDDNPVNRLLLARQLSQLGFEVDAATDGRAALDLFRTRHHVLIVTDCNMPEMDGYELTRAVRKFEDDENRPRVPIIGYSASAQAEIIAHCHESGMDDVLTKPAELGKLRALVSKWLPQSDASASDLSSPR